jgi:hypothetical protein
MTDATIAAQVYSIIHINLFNNYIINIDNYNTGSGESSRTCVAMDCENRKSFGDRKSCSIDGDTNTCYYKRRETECVEEPCTQVFFYFLFFKLDMNYSFV